MNCPVCPESRLVMADRSGIEIDYCPQCRGVWLDRGELDKIIERSPGAAPQQLESPRQTMPQPPQSSHGFATESVSRAPRRDNDDDDRRDRYRDRDDRDDDFRKRKKRGGFLEDLFDFD